MKPFLFFLLMALGLGFASCNQSTEDATEDATETIISDTGEIPKPGEKFMKDGVKTIILETKPWPVGDGNYPAAEGFNATDSDAKAIRLADSIVKYHGGWEAYANTRFLTWDFFGARKLSWDKHEKRVRIEAAKDNTLYLLDYSDEENLTGRVRRFGEEVTNTDSLEIFLNKAYSIWINDSYWLVHQFKLKDSGVTLKYGGEVRIDPQGNRPCYILEMTFEEVGDTPGNKYRLYVDKATFRINTWQFFRSADDEEPAMETPWNGYLPYGDIVLSGDRGGRFQLGGIGVNSTLSDKTFMEF
jgi:hypothetical protein